MHRSWISALIVLTIATATTACTTHHHHTIADPSAPNSHISKIVIEGDAELKAVPNEFVISLGVESFDANLKAAQDDNNKRVVDLLSRAEKLGIPRKYVITSDFQLRPHTIYHKGLKPDEEGFLVSRNITVILHDAERIEPALNAMLTDGANHLYGVQFLNTEIQKLRHEARLKAVSDARQKAESMAALLGVGLGEPIIIEESYPDHFSRGNFMYSEATPDAGEGISVGKIKVPAKVRVEFKLVSL